MTEDPHKERRGIVRKLWNVRYAISLIVLGASLALIFGVAAGLSVGRLLGFIALGVGGAFAMSIPFGLASGLIDFPDFRIRRRRNDR